MTYDLYKDQRRSWCIGPSQVVVCIVLSAVLCGSPRPRSRGQRQPRGPLSSADTALFIAAFKVDPIIIWGGGRHSLFMRHKRAR